MVKKRAQPSVIQGQALLVSAEKINEKRQSAVANDGAHRMRISRQMPIEVTFFKGVANVVRRC